MRARSAGFTLIEVLISAAILFIVLAVAAESYRASLVASRKADAVVRMLTPLPLITTTIRNALRADPRQRASGKSTLLGVEYEYEANTVRYGAPPKGFDADAGGAVDYQPRFRLYDVKLTLRLAGQTRQYLYQELAWEPLRQ